mgnify:CR=1 FL=1
MSESDLSQEFIKQQIEKYGSNIVIEKIIIPSRKGFPDIQGVFYGMPFYIEAKKINEISLINLHKFEPLQSRSLAIRFKAGAICVGLLMKSKHDIRYIDNKDIPENGYVTKEQFLNAEPFSWEKLYLNWMQRILTDLSPQLNLTYQCSDGKLEKNLKAIMSKHVGQI